MRLILVFLAAVAACGPSSKQIKAAKSATYTCDYDTVFKAVVDQMKTQAPIAVANPDEQFVATDFRWHTAAGVPKKKGMAYVGQGDLAYSAVIGIKDSGGGFSLVSQPRVLAHVVGSPRGREVQPGEGDWPDWADSKVDVLLVGIHERLGECAK